MTLGLFNSFFDHPIFAPVGDFIFFGTCDCEGAPVEDSIFFGTFDFERAPVGNLFFPNL